MSDTKWRHRARIVAYIELILGCIEFALLSLVVFYGSILLFVIGQMPIYNANKEDDHTNLVKRIAEFVEPLTFLFATCGIITTRVWFTRKLSLTTHTSADSTQALEAAQKNRIVHTLCLLFSIVPAAILFPALHQEKSNDTVFFWCLLIYLYFAVQRIAHIAIIHFYVVEVESSAINQAVCENANEINSGYKRFDNQA